MGSGANTPTSVAINCFFVWRNISASPLLFHFAVPEIFTYTTTPLCAEYEKSNTRRSRARFVRIFLARRRYLRNNGAKKHLHSLPVRPDTANTSLISHDNNFATSSFTSSVRASGESILETTGIITNPDARHRKHGKRLAPARPASHPPKNRPLHRVKRVIPHMKIYMPGSVYQV